MIDFVESSDIRDLTQHFLVDLVGQCIDRIVFTCDRVVVTTVSHPDYPNSGPGSGPQSRLQILKSSVPGLQAELERLAHVELVYSSPIKAELSK